VKESATLRKLAAVTAGAVYLLIVLGGVVRATGSGLGCPDWPTCYGSWIPPLERTALIEYSHRTLAAIVGVLAVAIVVLAGRNRHEDRRPWWLAVAALILLFVQAWLGRVVVLSELSAPLVSVHLGTAMSLLAVLLLIALPRVRLGSDWRLEGRLWIGAAAVLAVILVGALVRGSAAGLAFSDWPLMAGRLIPPDLDTGMRLVHFLHRLAALIVGLYLAYLWIYLRRTPAGRPVTTLAGWVLTMYTLQALIGASAVWTRLDAWTIVAHVGVAALTWSLAFLLPFSPSLAAPRPPEMEPAPSL
jgi:heme A synthase